MPSPATAPPSVIVFSCGTTSGISPCGEGRVDEPLVGHHALHVGGPGVRVDREHVVERAHVQPPGGRAAGREPEQVGGPLVQPHDARPRQRRRRTSGPRPPGRAPHTDPALTRSPRTKPYLSVRDGASPPNGRRKSHRLRGRRRRYHCACRGVQTRRAPSRRRLARRRASGPGQQPGHIDAIRRIAGEGGNSLGAAAHAARRRRARCPAGRGSARPRAGPGRARARARRPGRPSSSPRAPRARRTPAPGPAALGVRQRLGRGQRLLRHRVDAGRAPGQRPAQRVARARVAGPAGGVAVAVHGSTLRAFAHSRTPVPGSGG